MLSKMTANPDPVDGHVGARIRALRTLRGMSMEKLASATGVTYQQHQKYETGANRVSASRLWQIAAALSEEVSFFFDDMPPEVSGKARERAEAAEPLDDDMLAKRVTLELVRAYHGIGDAETRHLVYDLVLAIAEAAAGEQGTGRRAPGRPAKRAPQTSSRGRRR
jgi:transcriptional regulator with XRE-family HTH domain